MSDAAVTTGPLPTTRVPRLDATQYGQALLAAAKESYAAREAFRIDYARREHDLRRCFAQNRDSPAVSDPHALLVPVHALPKDALRVPRQWQEDVDAPLVMASADRPKEGTKVVADKSEFMLNWKLFTAGALDCLNWDNVFVAGGAVQACLSHLPPETTYGERRDFFLTKYGAGDIDLFIHGLDEEAARAKMEEVYQAVMDSVPFEVVVIRTTHACTIVSQYPYRHIQIILRLYKSPAETLMGFDVDACAVGYNGIDVLATPRAHIALITHINSIDVSRRSPTYEARLAKYSQRGYSVKVPNLHRDLVDPQIYERGFDKVQGLARLLVFEALGDQETRLQYKEAQRERKQRPAHKNAGRYEAQAWRRRRDLKARNDAFESSDYSSVFLPYGPEYTASKIVKLLAKKDRTLNNEWFMSKRGVSVHQHPVFFGTMEEVMGDCCGSCPPIVTPEDKEDVENFVHGPLTFMVDDPGRQTIGSFHPITDDDWAADAYITKDRSALVYAVAHGEIARVRSLLDTAHAKALAAPTEEERRKAWLMAIEARDWVGRSVLHVATMFRRLDMVKVLLEYGARVSSPMPDGRLALHLACEYGFLEIAQVLWAKAKENLEALKAKGDDAPASGQQTPEKKRGKKAASPDSDGDFEMVSAGSDGSGGDGSNDGGSAKGDNDDEDAEMAEAEEDAEEPDVHRVDHIDWDSGFSPLHYAVLYGHLDVARWLIKDAGASPKKAYKAEGSWRKYAAPALALAWLGPDEDKHLPMVELLIDSGALASDCDSNSTSVLKLALQAKRMDIVKYLLDSDPTATTFKTISDLVMDAIESKSVELLAQLLQLGAPAEFTKQWAVEYYKCPEDQAEYKIRYVDQPLSKAATGTPTAVHVEMVQLLLKHGADPNVKTSYYRAEPLVDQMFSKLADSNRDLERALEPVKKPRQPGDVVEEIKPEVFAARLKRMRESATYDEYLKRRDLGLEKDEADEDKAKKDNDEEKVRPELTEYIQSLHERVVSCIRIIDLLVEAGGKGQDMNLKESYSPQLYDYRVWASVEYGPDLFTVKLPTIAAKEHRPPSAMAIQPTDEVMKNQEDIDAAKAKAEAAVAARHGTYKLYRTEPRDKNKIPDHRQKHYHSLYKAIWLGDLSTIEKLVAKERLLLAVTNCNDESPLMIATLRRHAHILAWLMRTTHAQYKPLPPVEEDAKKKKKAALINNYELDDSDDEDGSSDDDDSYDNSDNDDDSGEETELHEQVDDRNAPSAMHHTHSATPLRDMLAMASRILAWSSYADPLTYCVLSGWEEGISTIISTYRGLGDKTYTFDVLKTTGIVKDEGDFIADYVANVVGVNITDPSRFTISTSSPFSLAMQLPDRLPILRVLVREALGGLYMPLFYFCDKRWDEEQTKLKWRDVYAGLGKSKGAKRKLNPTIILPVHIAAEYNRPDIIKYFVSKALQHDIDHFVTTRANHGDPRAAALIDPTERRRFMQRIFTLTHGYGSDKSKTAMHHAVEYHSLEAMDALAEHVKDHAVFSEKLLNATNDNGETPLHIVCRQSQTARRCLTKLLEMGADPLRVTKDRKWTPFHYLCASGPRKLVAPFLARVPLPTMAKILSAQSDTFGHTPLAVATLAGEYKTVRRILDYISKHGTELAAATAPAKPAEAILARDFAGKTAVQLAISKTDVRVLETLRDALPPAVKALDPAADPGAVWRQEDGDGLTPWARVFQMYRRPILSADSYELVNVLKEPDEDVPIETDNKDEDAIETDTEAEPEPVKDEKDVPKEKRARKDKPLSLWRIMQGTAPPTPTGHALAALDERILVEPTVAQRIPPAVGRIVKGECSNVHNYSQHAHVYNYYAQAWSLKGGVLVNAADGRPIEVYLGSF
ncbi:hypothetical protein AMAG_11682 [Allomyces macrogynus ATCC 38327]|uniref:Ankyrin repeat protein n=1 Tax=Allomyces macrogynus (strain ATCC 38327) TaxID=578462 RepID=A0A0L0SW45_ALLM3|nr:hypothetical protein AMAG_11682 [Allomyces macrogynus ATCC 38327]|eukprot:KNE66554.1 hypothetical protein AMAG_11682 [Allomyces macrogynus ATCC 38327]